MLINIVGSGNVATHLATSLASAGHTIAHVVSRSCANAEALAQRIEGLGASKPAASGRVERLGKAAVTLLCVTDSQIASVAETLPSGIGVVAHTSGATDMLSLSRCESYGVLYPCQTFTKSDAVDISRCPFLVEASDDNAKRVLVELASTLSSVPPRECDSNGRAVLHLAAVFASNFVNNMLLQSQEVLESVNLPLDTLRELVSRSVDKAFAMGPKDAQTGPARRHDHQTILRHESILKNSTISNINEKKDIYKLMTEVIGSRY